MTATASSIHNAIPLGMLSFSPMTAMPARNSDAVCPSPQDVPTSVERAILRDWLTIVETATMWSGSKAWRKPSAKPKPSAAVQIW